MATKPAVVAPSGATSGGSAGGGDPLLSGPNIPAATGTSTGITGLSSTDGGKTLFVPTTPGSHGASNIEQTTVLQWVQGVLGDPKALGGWEQYLYQNGLLKAPSASNHGQWTIPEITSALVQVATAAADSPDGNPNLDTYITNYAQAQAQASASAPVATSGGTRFYRGGTAQVAITSPETVKILGDAVAENLVGRRLTAKEVQSITTVLNSQEYQKGAADIATAQAQQAGYIEAIAGNGQSAAQAGIGTGGASTVGQITGTSGGNALAAIPGQYASVLQHLAQQGKLSGVDPQILAAISMAESSGKGGAINQAGYGGFFGLAPGTQYPGNNTVSRQQMTGTDTASFAAQAITAAAEFASLLNQFGGNVYLAETAYQQGPNSAAVKAGTPQGEGVNTFMSYGIGAQMGTSGPGPGIAVATDTSASSGPAGGVAPAPAAASPTGQTSNPLPAIPPVPPGGASSTTVGSSIPFTTAQGTTGFVMPPTVTEYTAPDSPENLTASALENFDSGEFQGHNLLNTLTALNDVISKGVSGGNNTLDTPVSMAGK